MQVITCRYSRRVVLWELASGECVPCKNARGESANSNLSDANTVVHNRHPEAPPTALLRQDLDRKSHKLKKVLMAPDLRKEFFGGCKADEAKVVKAFAGMNQENALKTKPKVSTAKKRLDRSLWRALLQHSGWLILQLSYRVTTQTILILHYYDYATSP